MTSEQQISGESQIPCIVDQGVVFSKKDMFRVLQSLDHIIYYEIVDGKVFLSREGFLVEIFEDPNEATVFFNRRIYLNLNSFEYLKINYGSPSTFNLSGDFPALEKAKETKKLIYWIELFLSSGREVVFLPMSDPLLSNKESLFLEVEERKRITSIAKEEGEWTEINSKEAQDED